MRTFILSTLLLASCAMPAFAQTHQRHTLPRHAAEFQALAPSPERNVVIDTHAGDRPRFCNWGWDSNCSAQ